MNQDGLGEIGLYNFSHGRRGLRPRRWLPGQLRRHRHGRSRRSAECRQRRRRRFPHRRRHDGDVHLLFATGCHRSDRSLPAVRRRRDRLTSKPESGQLLRQHGQLDRQLHEWGALHSGADGDADTDVHQHQHLDAHRILHHLPRPRLRRTRRPTRPPAPRLKHRPTPRRQPIPRPTHRRARRPTTPTNTPTAHRIGHRHADRTRRPIPPAPRPTHRPTPRRLRRPRRPPAPRPTRPPAPATSTPDRDAHHHRDQHADRHAHQDRDQHADQHRDEHARPRTPTSTATSTPTDTADQHRRPRSPTGTLDHHRDEHADQHGYQHPDPNADRHLDRDSDDHQYADCFAYPRPCHRPRDPYPVGSRGRPAGSTPDGPGGGGPGPEEALAPTRADSPPDPVEQDDRAPGREDGGAGVVRAWSALSCVAGSPNTNNALPPAIATCWRPSIVNDIGLVRTGEPVEKLHSGSPVAASSAKMCPSCVPPKTRPPAVAITPDHGGDSPRQLSRLRPANGWRSARRGRRPAPAG